MLSKKYFKFVMPFWNAFLVVTVMCCVMSVVNTGTIPFPGVLRDMLVGTLVAYSATLILPVNKWAEAFAGLFRAQHGTLVHTLLSNVVFTLVFGLLMTVLFTALAIGFPPYFLNACLGGLPLGLAVGYVAGLAVGPLALKLTQLTCSKD